MKDKKTAVLEEEKQETPTEEKETVAAATESETQASAEAPTEQVEQAKQPAQTENTKQETAAASTEEKKDTPTEEPVAEEKTENKTENKTEEKPQETAVEQPVETPVKIESTPPVYAYKTAIAMYTDAQALNFLRKKIYGYQEIDEHFLKRVAEDGAFTTEMKYISVVRCDSDTVYTWKTGSKEDLHEHNESKHLSKEFCEDVVELNPFDFGMAKTIDLEKPREDDKMLAKKSYSLPKAKKDFNVVIKGASPHKKAKFIKVNERYETMYIPVLKTSCVFEGETYLGYVNLINGACISEYKVSERLQNAVNATMGKVKAAKSALLHSLVFLALLCVMSLGKVFYHGLTKLTMPVLWTGVVMGVLMLVPIFSLGFTSKYKPEKMKEASVQTGKLPAAKRTKLLAILSWLVCLAAVIVFFLKTVL